MSNVPALTTPVPAPAAVDILGIEPALARIVGDHAGTERLRALVDYLRRLTNARAALLVAAGEGVEETAQAVLAESWADPVADRSRLASGLATALGDSSPNDRALARPLPGAAGLFLFSSPVTRTGKPPLRACLLLAGTGLREMEPFLVVLQAAAGFFHAAFEREEGGGAGSGEALLQAAALVEIGTRVGAAGDFPEAATILAEQLRRHVDCFWVCLGTARGGRVRLEAISGVARFEREGSSTVAIEAAMREALRSRKLVSCPDPAERPGDALSAMAHRELLRLLGAERTATVPLFHPDGKALGALTFVWDATHPFRAGADRLVEASTPYLQAQVEVLRRAQPPFWAQWWRHGWKGVAPGRRRIVAGGLCAAALLLFCPLPQHLHTACRVQPLEKRVVAAPFDGLLKEALVEPGQAVAAGTVLAVMDDKELRWREAEDYAQRDRALTARNEKMTGTDAANTPAQAQMAELEAQQHDLDLRVVEHEIGHLEVKSPIDGVILEGDLKRAAGAPLTKGQILFEVAPLDRLVVDIDVPDADAPYVRDGMEVAVRLEALPGQKFSGKIRKVNPQSELRDGENVFVAEAALPSGGETALLRPGMKGRAVIHGDARPLGWLLFHRVWGFFRLLLFW